MSGDIGCSLCISCVEENISYAVCFLGVRLGIVVVTLVLVAFLPIEAAGAHRSLSSSSKHLLGYLEWTLRLVGVLDDL